MSSESLSTKLYVNHKTNPSSNHHHLTYLFHDKMSNDLHSKNLQDMCMHVYNVYIYINIYILRRLFPHPHPQAPRVPVELKALVAHTAALWVQIHTGRCGCGGAGLQLLRNKETKWLRNCVCVCFDVWLEFKIKTQILCNIYI